MPPHPPTADRRLFLQQAGSGFGAIALSALTAADATAKPAPVAHAITNKSATWIGPQQARVKRVIWLFMHGGPSHVDLFDPKPELQRLSGQPVPDSIGMFKTRRNVAGNPLLAALKPFRPRGKAGLPISDFLPHIASHADDLCVIRSMHGDSVNHPQSVYQMNTGSILMGRPSVGSWVAYGIGSENQDLPAFVVLPDPAGGLKGGPPAWGGGFLPANYQGVTMRPGAQPILHLQPPKSMRLDQQRLALDMTQHLNRLHLSARGGDNQLGVVSLGGCR